MNTIGAHIRMKSATSGLYLNIFVKLMKAGFGTRRIFRFKALTEIGSNNSTCCFQEPVNAFQI